MGCQSPKQKDYITHCSVDRPLYVEGPFHLWLNKVKEEYFLLKTGQGDLVSSDSIQVDEDEEREGEHEHSGNIFLMNGSQIIGRANWKIWQGFYILPL